MCLSWLLMLGKVAILILVGSLASLCCLPGKKKKDPQRSKQKKGIEPPEKPSSKEPETGQKSGNPATSGPVNPVEKANSGKKVTPSVELPDAKVKSSPKTQAPRTEKTQVSSRHFSANKQSQDTALPHSAAVSRSKSRIEAAEALERKSSTGRRGQRSQRGSQVSNERLRRLGSKRTPASSKDYSSDNKKLPISGVFHSAEGSEKHSRNRREARFGALEPKTSIKRSRGGTKQSDVSTERSKRTAGSKTSEPGRSGRERVIKPTGRSTKSSGHSMSGKVTDQKKTGQHERAKIVPSQRSHSRNAPIQHSAKESPKRSRAGSNKRSESSKSSVTHPARQKSRRNEVHAKKERIRISAATDSHRNTKIRNRPSSTKSDKRSPNKPRSVGLETPSGSRSRSAATTSHSRSTKEAPKSTRKAVGREKKFTTIASSQSKDTGVKSRQPKTQEKSRKPGSKKSTTSIVSSQKSQLKTASKHGSSRSQKVGRPERKKSTASVGSSMKSQPRTASKQGSSQKLSRKQDRRKDPTKKTEGSQFKRSKSSLSQRTPVKKQKSGSVILSQSQKSRKATPRKNASPQNSRNSASSLGHLSSQKSRKLIPKLIQKRSPRGDPSKKRSKREAMIDVPNTHGSRKIA